MGVSKTPKKVHIAPPSSAKGKRKAALGKRKQATPPAPTPIPASTPALVPVPRVAPNVAARKLLAAALINQKEDLKHTSPLFKMGKLFVKSASTSALTPPT